MTWLSAMVGYQSLKNNTNFLNLKSDLKNFKTL